MFKKGVLFVAKKSIFFFNRKNNFFIQTNYFEGDDYDVSCFYPGLVAFRTPQYVHIFDFNNFYRMRHKNAIKFNVRFTDIIASGNEGNFYVTAGKKNKETTFYKLIWKNKDIFGRFEKSGIYNAIFDTNLKDDNPIPVTLNVTVVESESAKDLYTKMIPQNEMLTMKDGDKKDYILENIDIKNIPFWRFHLSDKSSKKDEYLEECMQNRL